MEEIKKGNFTFVEDIYPDLYGRLCEAESLAYLDCRAAGRTLRDVYEMWLTHLIEEYKIPLEGGRASLNDKRRALQEKEKLRYIGKYAYRSVTGGQAKKSAYIVWRDYGNQCSHPEQTDDAPAVTYENLEVVLRIAHAVFQEEYVRLRKKGSRKPEQFNPAIMPIGDNFVIRSYVPIDQPVSNCIKEFETCSYNEAGRVNKYGIVRIFQKKDMDEKLLRLRDQEAFSQAESEAGIQFDGNVQVEALSKMNAPNSDYYILIYKFTQKPTRLSASILHQMSMADRVGLCTRIGEIIQTFHGLQVPIYHRNLSYDSIYVCQNRAGIYEPSIIKLDCAKIVSGEFGTVIANVQKMQNGIKQLAVLKYAAPEVRRFMQDQSIGIDWGKADIYSLGILFADILGGQIEAAPVLSTALRGAGVDIALLQLVDRMRSPDIRQRPDMALVMQSMK